VKCARAVAVAGDGNRPWTKGCERRWKEEPKRGGVVGVCNKSVSG
jgi:hypothetical protein